METILRWRYPWRVTPAEIAAIAKMSGISGAVGRRVLKVACCQGSFWQRRYPEDPPVVSVNLSAGQLREPGLSNDVATALNSSGLDPANLALEIDEGFWAEATPLLALTIDRFRSLGVWSVIDSFG